jgi:hypothetical protein
MMLDAALHLFKDDVRYRYNLRGVVYHGKFHFTSRLIKPNGQVWYHDGILTGSKCMQDGILGALPPDYLNTCTDTDNVTRVAVGAIYALMDD